MDTENKPWGQIQQPQKAFGNWFWIALPLLVISIVTVAAIFWILAHPYGTNWDETNYINQAYRDVAAFRNEGVIKLLRVLAREDPSRPPAYRLLILPITLLFGANATLLRLISWIALGISLSLIYLTGKRLAGSTAGAFAITFLAVCPIIVGPNMRFYVDYTLYLATAATLYFLFRDWNNEQAAPRNWIGLGIALGLGGLAKPNIAFVVGPMLLLAFFLSWRKIISNPSPKSLVKSGALGLIIMLPWWLINFKLATAKAFRSGGNVRDALGPKGSPETLAKWLYVFVQSILGPAITLLTLAIIATFVFQLIRKQIKLDVTQRTALWVCLAGALPLPIIAAFGSNHNPRLIAVLLFPLAVALGMMAVFARWTSSKWLAGIATAVICFQLAVMVSPTPGEARYQAGDAASKDLNWGNPTSVMQRAEQWEWSQLRDIVKARGIENPQISYLGGADTFNPPQIIHPWIRANEEARATSLWTYTKGDIDWKKTMKSIQDQDVVLTIPSELVNDPFYDTFEAQGYSDNQNNAEFVEKLRQEPRFSEPVELTMGRFTPVKVLVFIRK